MRPQWNQKLGDRMVRHPRQSELEPVVLVADPRKTRSRARALPLLLLYAFIALIALATLLLSLPFTHRGDSIGHLSAALFTATSAVTVTGLTVRDTATYWTPAGQVLIAGIIFVGGLGFMTLATFILVITRQQVTLSQRLLIRESLGGDLMSDGNGGIVRLTIGIVMFAAGTQLVGFIFFFARFRDMYPTADALRVAMFQSVSAFNNAGFIVFPNEDGLRAFQSDWVVMGLTGGMIFLGALSYGALLDVARYRRFRLFGLTTKLVLTLTALLTLMGMGIFLAFEYDNPETLGALPVGQKIAVALFESISGRTAGFSTLDYAVTQQETNFMMTGLMFVGGASVSVAGGIKINTLAVVLVAVLSTMRGRRRTSAFKRDIPDYLVRNALVIGAVGTAMAFAVIVALSVSDGSNLDFLHIFFEGVSAFGTVGLSAGITSTLSQWGQFILMVAMLIGRVGPFTIGVAMTQQTGPDRYQFAEERVTIG